MGAELEFGVTLWYEDAVVRLIVIDHVCFIVYYNCHSTLSYYKIQLKDKTSNDENDSDTGYHTPPEVAEAAKAIGKNLLPSKSKAKYETTYKKFMEWRGNPKLESLSELVFFFSNTRIY